MTKLESLFILLGNGDIEINKVELHRRVFLKEIINKPKTQESINKLMFIYLMADIGSMYDHLSGDDKLKAVKAHLGYDESWIVTPDINLAIEAYKESVDISASGSAYRAASRGLYETGRDLDNQMEIVSILKGALNTRINNVKNSTQFTETEKMTNINEARGHLNELASTQKSLIENIKNLPSLIKTVKDLATVFAEENAGGKRVHGGGELGNRE